jgi:hypothetical protein
MIGGGVLLNSVKCGCLTSAGLTFLDSFFTEMGVTQQRRYDWPIQALSGEVTLCLKPARPWRRHHREFNVYLG